MLTLYNRENDLMFKRFTLAAVAAAFAVLSMPAASEAGHMKREARPARATCALTHMMTRIARAPRVALVRPVVARPVVVAPRVHVRRERPEWLKRLMAPRVAVARPARVAVVHARPVRVAHVRTRRAH